MELRSIIATTTGALLLCTLTAVLLSATDSGPSGDSVFTSNLDAAEFGWSATPPQSKYTLGPEYTPDPIYTPALDSVSQGKGFPAPQGKWYHIIYPANKSHYYNCAYIPRVQQICAEYRQISVYIPTQYKDGREAALMFATDGPAPANTNAAPAVAIWDQLIPPVMDALIQNPQSQRRLPVSILVLMDNGQSTAPYPPPFGSSERDNEYETLSGLYGKFVNNEVLPKVLADPRIRTDYPNLKITSDPHGRTVIGSSSGGAAAFSMAWFNEKLFGRVVSYSMSAAYRGNANPNSNNLLSSSVFSLAGAEYYEGLKLILNTPKKDLRIFHSAGQYDIGSGPVPSSLSNAGCSALGAKLGQTPTNPDACASGPNAAPTAETPCPTKCNWRLLNDKVNQDLEAMGYKTRYAYGLDSCHVDPGLQLEDLPNTLSWVWEGWEGQSTWGK